MPPTAIAAVAVEIFLLLAGIAMLWRVVLSPASRQARGGPGLGHWPVRPLEFMIFLWILFMGLAIGAGVAHQVALVWLEVGGPNPDQDTRVLVAGLGGQVGMLLACLWFRLLPKAEVPAEARPAVTAPAAWAGAVTFTIALPLVGLTAWLWEKVLRGLGVPVEPQKLVDIFMGAETPGFRAVLVLFAIVIAPVTEELVFRAGLYRFLRTRVPRIVALVAPALAFALLHVEDWETLDGIAAVGPLVALAVVLALAYERTGRIAVPIVAHALFNANTLMLLLSGVPSDF